ncbi:universal stress protein [Treponema sp.]|uniref:universal stress protein n=1 Tax=Treponema sp. TaxID=166 RepID=UPI0025FE822D|nr:universal stress protein [Treponema sp.]MCR5218801.1 universal stress protein [Treponema sp.]
MKKLLEKVLVACNGSDSSLRAVKYAVILSRQTGIKVKVVYIVDSASIKQLTLSRFMDPEEAANIAKRLKDDGIHILEHIKSLAKTKRVDIETELRDGAVWSQVISAADEWQADLIMLGGTSEGNNMRALNRASVTKQDNEIIGSAHTSVMVVRENQIDQLFKIL